MKILLGKWFRRKVVRRWVNARWRKSAAGMSVEQLEVRWLASLIVPLLSSQPGAAQTLYLDFDGSASFLWNGADSGDAYVVRGPNSSDFEPTSVPAFTTDADANNFSAAELTNIRNIHAWVAEKFSPFAINVTTSNPVVVALNVRASSKMQTRP